MALFYSYSAPVVARKNHSERQIRLQNETCIYIDLMEEVEIVQRVDRH
jgi:hypothetical protein